MNHVCDGTKYQRVFIRYVDYGGQGKFWQLEFGRTMVVMILFCPYCGASLTKDFNSKREQ